MERARLIAVWRLVAFTISRVLRVKGYGISVLVPLNVGSQYDPRATNWQWLERYWKANLPGAEIIIGVDRDAGSLAFSKSAAVNDAARKAHGDILVIADADVYIPIDSVLRCAREIRLAEEKGRKLWFMPYRQAYRLTREATEKIILRSNPKRPREIHPTERDITNVAKPGNKTPPSWIAHWYGAMIHIVSREAFLIVGGWDTRFRGWGGEDHAAMAAMDTLYGPHKTLPAPVIHLWHPVLTPGSVESDAKAKKKLWNNQDAAANNNALSIRYYEFHGNPEGMRRLLNEARENAPVTPRSGKVPPCVSS